VIAILIATTLDEMAMAAEDYYTTDYIWPIAIASGLFIACWTYYRGMPLSLVPSLLCFFPPSPFYSHSLSILPSLHYPSSLPPSLLPSGKLRAASCIAGSPIEYLFISLFLPCALAQEARPANVDGQPVKEIVTGDVLVSARKCREGGGGGRKEKRGKRQGRRRGRSERGT